MLCNEFLCEPCSRLIASGSDKHGNGHHPSIEAFERSAQDGCPLCVQLWDIYFHRVDNPLLSDENFTKSGFSFTNSLKRNVFWHGNDILAVIEFTAINYSNEIATFEVTGHTGNTESKDLALKWLRTCVATHKECNRSENNYFPTRAIYVGTVKDPRLHLYIRNQSSQPGPYATLSHCWGTFPLMRLLSATISSMIEGIVFDELPKTFQEAISFARHLGIQYLWIDSLCIIQDLITDWEDESARMESVYKNSVCNIAAAAAADSRDGCFVDRNPMQAQACRVSRIEMARHSSQDFSTTTYDITCVGRFNTRAHDEAPLKKRAWVLQEEYLADRIIYCTRKQLIWECRELSASEMYPHGLPSAKGGYKKSTFNFYTQTSAKDSSEEDINNRDGKTSALRSWRFIVTEYSKRSLTKEQDKLIALSGLAKDMQPLIHNGEGEARYLAGLWERFLPVQLLWQAAPWIPIEPVKTLTYVAPSWSWASIHGQIDVDRRDGVDLFMIQVLDAVTKPTTSNLMGQISDGHICLRGWLKQFSILMRKPRRASFEITPERNGEIYFDEAPPPPKLLFLPILKGDTVTGLVLTPTGKPNNYRRVGIFDSRTETKYFERPEYPSTSKTPTDGKTSFSNVILELIQGIDVDACHALEYLSQLPNHVPRERCVGGIDDDYDAGWVESIITIV